MQRGASDFGSRTFVDGNALNGNVTSNNGAFSSTTGFKINKSGALRRLFVQDGVTGNLCSVSVDAHDDARAIKRKVQAQLRTPMDTYQTQLYVHGEVIDNSKEVVPALNGKNEVTLLSRGIERSLSTPCLQPLATLEGENGTPTTPTSRRSTAGARSLSLEVVAGGRREDSGSDFDEAAYDLVAAAAAGALAGAKPEILSGGLGGAYLFRDVRGEPVGVLKPSDEEPLAPNNPKGFSGRELGQPGLKRAVRVGEASIREVAAYLLDYEGFSNVPCTALVKCDHYPTKHSQARSPVSPLRFPADASSSSDDSSGDEEGPAEKDSLAVDDARELQQDGGGGGDTISIVESALQQQGGEKKKFLSSSSKKSLFGGVACVAKLGSFQRYAHHSCDANDVGAASFPSDQVRRIGIFDVRTLNLDRHAGNILIDNRQSTKLVPIDHGFCLPETIEDPYLEWAFWPQASTPFDKEELEYIANLDAAKDGDMLRRELPMIRPACLRVLEISTEVLKAAAAGGSTLSEIGSFWTRPTIAPGQPQQPSPCELLCREALLASQGHQNHNHNLIDNHSAQEHRHHQQQQQGDGHSGPPSEDLSPRSPALSFADDSMMELFSFDEEDDSTNEDDSNGGPHLSASQRQPHRGPPPSPLRRPRACSNAGASIAGHWAPTRQLSVAAAAGDETSPLATSHSKPFKLASANANVNGNGVEVGTLTPIKFGDLSADEWGRFMECLSSMLPSFVALENARCAAERAAPLSTSCAF